MPLLSAISPAMYVHYLGTEALLIKLKFKTIVNAWMYVFIFLYVVRGLVTLTVLFDRKTKLTQSEALFLNTLVVLNAAG